jgi:hypothetical protein
VQQSFLWESSRDFRLWRYGVGHSRLLIRSQGENGDDVLDIFCDGVEFISLQRAYSGISLAIVEREDSSEFEMGALCPLPLLFLKISSPSGSGLIACARLEIIRSRSVEDNQSWPEGEIVLSAIA